MKWICVENFFKNRLVDTMKKSTPLTIILLSLVGTFFITSCYTPSKISKEAASIDNTINADVENLHHNIKHL